MLQCVFVGDDRGAKIVHPFIAVGMIPMPVSIDDVLDWTLADAVQNERKRERHRKEKANRFHRVLWNVPQYYFRSRPDLEVHYGQISSTKAVDIAAKLEICFSISH